jgi:hypothetical protein
MYAFDKPKGQIKGLLAIVSPQDLLITPSDMKMIKGVTETYIIKASPKNAENFTTDKNAYFERVAKFLGP